MQKISLLPDDWIHSLVLFPALFLLCSFLTSLCVSVWAPSSRVLQNRGWWRDTATAVASAIRLCCVWPCLDQSSAVVTIAQWSLCPGLVWQYWSVLSRAPYWDIDHPSLFPHPTWFQPWIARVHVIIVTVMLMQVIKELAKVTRWWRSPNLDMNKPGSDQCVMCHDGHVISVFCSVIYSAVVIPSNNASHESWT